jgi:ABC-type uncharacterized transport system substrate-binding protein
VLTARQKGESCHRCARFSYIRAALAAHQSKAAGYVDHILRGASPADLPVQTPTKCITTLNLKTAKGLGLDVPPGVLAIADEVIE